MSKFYVTYYEEYPIYEAAEGGYYYAGVEVSEYEECDSIEEAKDVLSNMAHEYGLELIRENFAVERSKYIGQERYIRIETEENKFSEVSGKQVYC